MDTQTVACVMLLSLKLTTDSLWDGEDKKPKKSSTETTLRWVGLLIS